MRGMRWFVLAGAIAVAALFGAMGCEAKLDGAPCPCLEPEYTCIDEVCRRPRDGSPDFPDGSIGDADGGPISDASFGTPDAGAAGDASLL